jgi:hypothetical protein
VASTVLATAQPAADGPGDGSIGHKPRIIVTTDLGDDGRSPHALLLREGPPVHLLQSLPGTAAQPPDQFPVLV